MGLNIGDIVEISRRGDVIPHVEKLFPKSLWVFYQHQTNVRFVNQN
jgi:NAD-dependent DNA ligase